MPSNPIDRNPYAPLLGESNHNRVGRFARLGPGLIVAFSISATGCFGLLIKGIYDALGTIGFMGIILNSDGSPVEVEGIPLILGGLIGSCISVLAVIMCFVRLQAERK